MSHTNSTTHYSLPQFVGTDTPGWLTDVNSAMSSIDAAIFARQQESVSNSDAITANTAAISGLTTRMDTAEQNITETGDQVSSHTASIATLQSQVAQNTGDIAGLATRVTNLAGSDVSYVPTGTDLTATDVQAAITEVNTKVDSAVGIDLLWTNENPTQSFNAQTISLDLSGYRFVIVSGAVPNYGNQKFYVMCEVGETTYLFAMTNSRHGRSVAPTAAGVTFGSGQKSSVITENMRDDNSTMIPQKIWGIK